MTGSGRLFQTRAAATEKARSPTVGSRVRLTINDEDELERSRGREGDMSPMFIVVVALWANSKVTPAFLPRLSSAR